MLYLSHRWEGGRLLGAQWMRHASADMLNYCFTPVDIGDNVQVIALPSPSFRQRGTLDRHDLRITALFISQDFLSFWLHFTRA